MSKKVLKIPIPFTKKSDSMIEYGKISKSSWWYSMGLWGYVQGNHTIDNFVTKGYGKNPYLYSIIDKISKTAAGLDHELIDVNNEVVRNGDVFDFIEKPNTTEFFDDWYQKICASLLSGGNAYLKPVSIPGFFSALDCTIIPPQNVEILTDSFNKKTGYRVEENNRFVDYGLDEIIHIKFANIVNTGDKKIHYGLSPLQAAYMAFSGSNDLFEAKGSIFKNRGVVGFLTNESDVPVLPKEKDQLQKDFDSETSGAWRFGKIAISNKKLKYVNVGMSPNDLKMIELNVADLRVLCSIYGVDSSLFNDPQNKTYSNRTEAEKAFYTNTVLPLTTKINRVINYEIISAIFRSGDKLTVYKNTIEALNIVNKDLSKKVIEELKSGIISVKEARELLGYDSNNQ